MQSNSVTKQVSFDKIKIGENTKFKCDISSNFQTLTVFEIHIESHLS